MVNLLILTAAQPTDGVGGFLSTLGFPILLLGAMLLMFYLPERKRRKNFNSMLSNLKVNDEIFTTGGIIGKLVKVDEGYVILETGPDRVRIKLDKRGIHSVLNKADDKKEAVEIKEDKK